MTENDYILSLLSIQDSILSLQLLAVGKKDEELLTLACSNITAIIAKY